MQFPVTEAIVRHAEKSLVVDRTFRNTIDTFHILRNCQLALFGKLILCTPIAVLPQWTWVNYSQDERLQNIELVSDGYAEGDAGKTIYILDLPLNNLKRIFTLSYGVSPHSLLFFNKYVARRGRIWKSDLQLLIPYYPA